MRLLLWLFYGVLMSILVSHGVHAADADPNGFQGNPRTERPHPCYQSTVIDCVELMQQQGMPAYCEWAAAIVAYAVWQREAGVPEKNIKIVGQRSFTANETKHIRAWVHYGYISPKAPYFAMNDVRDECNRSHGALPEWKEARRR